VIIGRVAERIEQIIADDPSHPSLPILIALYGMYRPLYGLDPGRTHIIIKQSWPAALSSLIRVQLLEPNKEEELRATVLTITPVRDDLSLQVRAMYEENPYPRWTKPFRAPGQSTVQQITAALGGQPQSNPAFTEAPEVLIAGCGTGRQSIYAASRYENANILAVDITHRSLVYAIRKSKELGYNAIDYRHGDILELASLNRRFHVIECAGVLHHMQNPLAAWKILADKLYPGGLMMVALYSRISHRRVIMAREYIAEKGYQPTAPDIRRFRQDILNLPDDHPLAAIKWLWPDFYNTSECRDLFFHVQAHRYTLPEIQAMLADLGLRFLTFTAPNPAYRARFPNDQSMTSLDNWDIFEQENPDMFSKMYQFWTQKAGNASN
jgi:2-polyprenyl-3-methyl-5-hydroxy-6-metoxy-1,4-benzoquinol methylase